MQASALVAIDLSGALDRNFINGAPVGLKEGHIIDRAGAARPQARPFPRERKPVVRGAGCAPRCIAWRGGESDMAVIVMIAGR
jgi:hypothetical protein